jgi:hypothetical protein
MLLARAVFCGLGTVEYANGGVVNPGFETGDFTNWTQIGDTGFTTVTSASCGHGAFTCTPHTGSFAAFFGNPSLGGITQSLATVPSTTYNVDFWLVVDVDKRGYVGTEYRVSWDSTILADVVDAPIAPWQHLSFTTTAGGTTSVLKFEFRNSPDWFGLDDVNVAAGDGVPEPVSSILAGTSLIALAGLRRMLRRC